MQYRTNSKNGDALSALGFGCMRFTKRGGAIDQATATGGNGGILAEDPCEESAAFKLKLVNAQLKAAGVGDPRWNPLSPNYYSVD